MPTRKGITNVQTQRHDVNEQHWCCPGPTQNVMKNQPAPGFFSRPANIESKLTHPNKDIDNMETCMVDISLNLHINYDYFYLKTQHQKYL